MADILDKITKVVSGGGIITGEDVKKRPADWMGHGQCQAMAIVRPRTAQELSEVMKLCYAAGQPVVAVGGHTGLVQGADPTDQQIMISMERMSGVQSIDPLGRTMTVLAGTPLQSAQEAAKDAGLLFAVDLGARGSATIGGNISTNAGGNQVIRYGMMRENILGLEAVLADGRIVSSMNRLLKNNAGYDLKQLFIGSEGTLGIVTRAVLKLQALPKSDNTGLVAVDDFAALKKIFRSAVDNFPDTLTAFEVMWKNHYDLIARQSGRHKTPIETEAGYYVIIETAGSAPDQDKDRFESVFGRWLESGDILDAVIANSQSQRAAIWAIREDIEGVTNAIMPACIFDVSLPISAMETYIDQLEKDLLARFGEDYQIVIFGHLGDGNLHLGIGPRPWSEDSHAAVEQLVYRPLKAIGGSISAEHGIGLEKRSYLNLSRSDTEIALMKQIKTALDPRNILNPGKIFA